MSLTTKWKLCDGTKLFKNWQFLKLQLFSFIINEYAFIKIKCHRIIVKTVKNVVLVLKYKLVKFQITFI